MGFIKLDRKLFQSELWLREQFTYGQAWVDLIAMANWTDKDKFYRNQHQKVKRGQIVTSQQSLADRWKWSRRQVRTYLRNLNESNMVTIKSTRNYTTITIVNYAIYQDARPTDGPTNGQRKTNRRPTDDQQTTTQEESKEGKKEKIYIPTRADVASYVSEKALPGDPDDVFDYYEAIGWEINGKPIKDWRAVVRRWKQYEPPEQKKTGLDMDKVNEYLDKLERGESIYD